MRKTKILKIDDKEITVKELRVKDIRKILLIGERLEDGNILENIEKLLPFAADIKIEDLEGMAPSEIKMIWEGFKEVNAAFLSVVERLGIVKTLENSIRKHLTEAFADLSSTGISEHGNTGGASL